MPRSICPFARGVLETCYRHQVDDVTATSVLLQETAKQASQGQPIRQDNPAFPMLLEIGRKKLLGTTWIS